MSVIIRLQNLPWSANALDIRQFFNGLSIPEGGVHIVGGELGDAFIAFSTDEDARQAFNLNGGKLKEVQVKLRLSSRTEMQKVIESARNPLAAFMQAAPVPQPLPAIIPASIPSIIPEVSKKDEPSKDKDKRDKRRSRSRSRDRKDRSRERDRRDRRRRDRSRSRSRDRRDRRRRDRSHSKDRRSKDRDRRSKDRKHADDNAHSNNAQKEPVKVEVWEDPLRNAAQSSTLQAQAILNSLIPKHFDEQRRNLNSVSPSTSLNISHRNGFQAQNDQLFDSRGRDNWNAGPMQQNEFQSRFDKNMQGSRNDDFNHSAPYRGPMLNQPFGDDQRSTTGSRATRYDGRPSRFDNEKIPMLDHPSLPDRAGLQPKNCCVKLQPYYGGYGEVRRYFQGLFIHNTGIKFPTDETGKRTGIVHIRFATPDGKEKALLRSGGYLRNHDVQIEHLDDDLFENTIDRYHPDFSKEHDRESPERQFHRKGSPTSNQSPNQFSCLAVESLPLFTKEQDMLKIFSDYSLLSILLINKHRHVIAYIKFSKADDAKAAQTEKSNYIFDGKLLKIRSCSDEEFAMINQEEPDNDEVIEIRDGDDKPFIESECVCLSGLPLKTTDRDISDFFSDVAIVPKKIHLVNSNLGFTGTAYCEFSSMDDAEVAIDKTGLPLGSGTVTVQSVPREEMEMRAGGNSMNMIGGKRPPSLMRPMFYPRGYGRGGFGPRPMGMMGPRPMMRRFVPPAGDPNDMAPPGHTVRMENVPYKSVLGEILDFFDGFEVPADNVLRRYNENGTPSGEAKVIFNSPEEAYQACQERNLCKIRERTIFLEQC